MANFRNLSVVVTKRASGIRGPDNFTVVDLDSPQATGCALVVRVRYASVDPAMRGWVSSVLLLNDAARLGNFWNSGRRSSRW
jgi:NADPH-dependent curcumin reductase